LHRPAGHFPAEDLSLLAARHRVGTREIELVAVVPDRDLPFLRQLYGSTRAQELAQVPWDDAQKAQFLDFQFHAQHSYYQTHFPDAHRWLIQLDDEPIGRLYLDRRASELRLIDIALLPAHCGLGYGGALLRAVLKLGADNASAVSIHVEQNNPALRLYQRLGFREVETQGIYQLMRWDPPGTQAANAQAAS
jgi:ribosomal protein S18 acetylase RimI-like enzyme